MAKQLKTLKALKSRGLPEEAPPAAIETPQRALQRLTTEEAQVTEAIRTLKAERRAENVRAQQCHESVPTPMITHWETRHRELAARLLAIHTESAAIRKEVRSNKAERSGNGHRRVEEPLTPQRNGFKQAAPLKRNDAFPTYFMLAAESELAPTMFNKITFTAKSMLRDALAMGVEQ
jgi:hypothetical protein